MRLIEAMKALKRLNERVYDLTQKIQRDCALLEDEESPYENPTAQITAWRQSAIDTLAEIARLRMAITRTNLATDVTIELGGVHVTKPIAYWVCRRRELCALEQGVWRAHTDRNLKPKAYQKGENGEVGVYQVQRFFGVEARDKALEILREEPSLIDAALEIANATTELILE